MPKRAASSRPSSRSRSPRSPSNSPRVKHSTTKIHDLLKVVGQLSEVGFERWLKSIQHTAHRENWYDTEAGLFDTELGWQPSDFDPTQTDKKSKANYKLCYSLIYETCRDVDHLFEDVAIGDTIAAYARITRVYNRHTTEGFLAAQHTFTGTSMAKDNVNINQFISLITSRAKRVISLGGNVSEAEKSPYC